MANENAKFTIDGTPSEDVSTGDRKFVASNSQTLTLQLEIQPNSGLSVLFEVYSSADESSPLASFNATAITFTASGTYQQILADTSSTTTIDMPPTGVHSYIIRATVSLDTGPQVFERLVYIEKTTTTPNIRKTVPTESQEARERGWSDDWNNLVDAVGAAAGGSPLTTKGDVYTYGVADARLPVGIDGYLLQANSAEATGLKWVDSSGSPLTTKGDLFGFSTIDTRVAIGSIGQSLLSNPAVAAGVSWGFTGGGIWDVTSIKLTGDSPYSASISELVQTNPSTGAITVTLPAVNAANKGKAIAVKNYNDASPGYLVTVNPTGSDTIDNNKSHILDELNQWAIYVSDGTDNWIQIG